MKRILSCDNWTHAECSPRDLRPGYRSCDCRNCWNLSGRLRNTGWMGKNVSSIFQISKFIYNKNDIFSAKN